MATHADDVFDDSSPQALLEDEHSEFDSIMGWPADAARRLATAAQALQTFGFSRVNMDDLRAVITRSRQLFREPLTNPGDELVYAAIEHASNVATAVQHCLADMDHICKLDQQAYFAPGRIFKLTIEYTIYFVAFLQRVSELGDLKTNSFIYPILLQSTTAMHTLLWPQSDLNTKFLKPQYVGTLMEQGFQLRLKAKCSPMTVAGAEEPDIDNLITDSMPALLSDLFIRLGGLCLLSEIVSKLESVNLNGLMTVLHLVQLLDTDVLTAAAGPESGVQYTTRHAQELEEVLQRTCAAIMQQIHDDTEKLAERERVFAYLSRTFEGMVVVRCALGQNTPQVRIAVNSEVTAMQQCFVLRMLRSTNFNNLLSAARECHHMLTRAVELLPVDDGRALTAADAWLHEHAVIQTLLKANLHQRQYADVVLAILQVLTRYGMIRTEHLDMLWAVTEAEGTFDMVKANVYAMIQDLAANLDTALLEQLFAKFEVLAQGRSVADSMRLLDLLKKLATSNNATPQTPDSTNVTAERLLALIWKLTMPADAAPELLACDAMADVLRQYGGIGHRLYCKQYLGRCCQELVCRTNVLTALRTLRRLLALYELFDQEGQIRGLNAMDEGCSGGVSSGPEPLLHSVLAELEQEFQLQRLLVSNTVALMDAARLAPVLQRAASGHRSSSSGDILCLRVPGYGSQPYSTLLAEYMQTISYVASKQKSYYDQHWAEQLFDALVLTPVLPTDAELGLQFIQEGASPQSSEFLSHTTQQSLLDTRLTSLQPGVLSHLAWQVFAHYFYKVNMEAKLVQVDNTDSSNTEAAQHYACTLEQARIPSVDALHGVSFVWQVALQADHPDVAQQAADLLIQVYIRGSKDSLQESHAIATFTKLCTQACLQAAQPALKSNSNATQSRNTHDNTTYAAHSPANQSVLLPELPDLLPHPAAVRYVQRCLYLLCQAAEAGQLPTLPLVPSHQSTYQAIPWEFEVATPRKFRSCAGPHEYVGAVRRMLAAELSCEPQRLRLICSGAEWKNDAQILRQVMQRPEPQHRQSMQVVINPVANTYTQPGPDYPARWQSTVLALLAKEPSMYEALIKLSAHTQWSELSCHAVKLLQLLPTDPAVSTALTTALKQAPGMAAASLQSLLLPGPSSSVNQLGNEQATEQQTMQQDAQEMQSLSPARLTYWIQALHALLFPSTSASYCMDNTTNSVSQKQANIQILLRSLVSCLGVLQDALNATERMIQANTDVQRLQQMLELYTQLVQLLHNLAKKENLQFLQAPRTGITRNVNIEIQLNSPSDYPSSGGITLGSLGTPTSMLQNLCVISPDTEGESSMSGTDASAVQRVHNTDKVPMQPIAEANDEAVNSADIEMGAGSQSALRIPMVDSQSTASELAGSPVVTSEQPAATLVGFLVQTCWQACHVASCIVSNQNQNIETVRDIDVQLKEKDKSVTDKLPPTAVAAVLESATAIRDGLTTLTKLLHALPELYPAFLAHTRSTSLVSELLLMPYSNVIRTATYSALRSTCVLAMGNNLPDAYTWLLQQLVKARSASVQHSSTNKEYAQLVMEVISMLPKFKSYASNPIEPQALASQLLHEELAALQRTFPPLDQLDTTSMATSEDGQPVQSNHGISSQHTQLELQGRLELVTELLRALKESSSGDAGQASLIQLLLERHLFPEAYLYKQTKGEAPPNQLKAVHGICATEPATRLAAFNLLAELMSGSSASMIKGTETLSSLHYSQSGDRLTRLPERKGEVQEALRASNCYCGLRNGGATCYMNSIIQQLFMQPHVRAGLLAGLPLPADEASESMYAQLQDLMAQLSFSCSVAIKPEAFWLSVKDYDGLPVDLKEHQDASEFFTRLQDAVDSHMKSTGQRPALTSVFGGKFAQQVFSRDSPHRSEREDHFDQVSVDVKGKGTLQNSLASYVQGELMEGDNAWHCEELGRKVTAIKRAAFKQLPTTLIIHLKRFEYDHIANQRYKVRERFEFPEVLDMYPYTVEGLTAAEANIQTSSCSGGSDSTTNSTGSTGVDTQMSDTDDQKQSVDPDSPEYQKKYKYELRGVVIHTGSAFAGHYYSFIKERPRVKRLPNGDVVPCKPGQWYQFDDKTVKVWDPSAMAEYCFGGPGFAEPGSGDQANDVPNSAFMLFYDRMDGTCVETDPVPSFLPPSCMLDTEQQQQTVGAEELQANVQRTTTPEDANEQQQPSANVEVPYGMPSQLYHRILKENLQLIRRLRAFDRDYIQFVRKVCEQRLDRSGEEGGRKARRTRLLDGGREGSTDPSHSGAEGGVGSVTCPSPSPTSMGGAPPGTSKESTRRDAQAAREAAQLAVDFLFNVLLHAPSAITSAELEPWYQLIQKCIAIGPEVIQGMVKTMTVTPDQIRMINLMHVGTRPYMGIQPWVQQLLDLLQLYLVAFQNQAALRLESSLPLDFSNDLDIDDFGAVLDNQPAGATHLEFLSKFAVEPLAHQMSLLEKAHAYHNSKALKQRNLVLNPASRAAYDQPYWNHACYFRLLAVAVSLDAPAAQQDDIINIAAAAVIEFSNFLTDKQADYNVESMTDFSAAITLFLQVILRLQEPTQFFPQCQQNERQCPDTELRRLCAEWSALPRRLDTIDPGPHQFVSPVFVLDATHRKQIKASARAETNAVLNALFMHPVPAMQANAMLLRVLCWNEEVFSYHAGIKLIRYLQSQEMDSLGSDPDVICAIYKAATAMVQSEDKHQYHRLVFLLNFNNANTGLLYGGLEPLLTQGEEVHTYAAWIVLGASVDEVRLAQKFQQHIQRVRSGAVGATEAQDAVLKLLLEQSENVGEVYQCFDHMNDFKDATVQEAKSRTQLLLKQVYTMRNSLIRILQQQQQQRDQLRQQQEREAEEAQASEQQADENGSSSVEVDDIQDSQEEVPSVESEGQPDNNDDVESAQVADAPEAQNEGGSEVDESGN